MFIVSSLIGFLAPRLGKNGEKLAGPVAYLILAIGAAILLFGGRPSTITASSKARHQGRSEDRESRPQG
jgi:hypothetical protein